MPTHASPTTLVAAALLLISPGRFRIEPPTI